MCVRAISICQNFDSIIRSVFISFTETLYIYWSSDLIPLHIVGKLRRLAFTLPEKLTFMQKY